MISQVLAGRKHSHGIDLVGPPTVGAWKVDDDGATTRPPCSNPQPGNLHERRRQIWFGDFGEIADLMLLDADPLRDILNTTKISAVFLGGKEFNRVKLDQILQNAQDSAATRPR